MSDKAFAKLNTRLGGTESPDKPFKWWQSKAAKELAKAEGYTPQQMKEYAAYVDLFIEIGK